MPRAKIALAEKVLEGDSAAAARLISLIEDGAPEGLAQLDRLYPRTGKAHVVGVTGAPGVGKSTLVDCLIGHFRRQDRKIGVIAIDPTSALTGGALLGDRVRMQWHSADPAVFIRSLATRGWEGGLARAAIGAVHVLDALGSDVVLVETVGSGQVETDIARAADTTVLVVAPGGGDEIQAMKAGIIESADVIVVNKADREGADRLKTDLELSCGMAGRGPSDWKPPVILAEAINDRGTGEVAGAIQRHHDCLVAGGALVRRRHERARLELLGEVEASVREGLRRMEEDGRLDGLVDDVRLGKISPRRAARDIIKRLNMKFSRPDSGSGV
jgi:LAO/AO transport system kinase